MQAPTEIIFDVRKLLRSFHNGNTPTIARELRDFGYPRITPKGIQKWAERGLIRCDWLVRLLVYARYRLGVLLDVNDFIITVPENPRSVRRTKKQAWKRPVNARPLRTPG